MSNVGSAAHEPVSGMRKYRNLKNNPQPQKITKYSEEYLQYRQVRGSHSVKASLCDTDADGFEDAISKAWRSPALKKLQICESQSSDSFLQTLDAQTLVNYLIQTIGVEAVINLLKPSTVNSLVSLPDNPGQAGSLSALPDNPGQAGSLSTIPDDPGQVTGLVAENPLEVPGHVSSLSALPDDPGQVTGLTAEIQVVVPTRCVDSYDVTKDGVVVDTLTWNSSERGTSGFGRYEGVTYHLELHSNLTWYYFKITTADGNYYSTPFGDTYSGITLMIGSFNNNANTGCLELETPYFYATALPAVQDHQGLVITESANTNPLEVPGHVSSLSALPDDPGQVTGLTAEIPEVNYIISVIQDISSTSNIDFTEQQLSQSVLRFDHPPQAIPVSSTLGRWNKVFDGPDIDLQDWGHPSSVVYPYGVVYEIDKSTAASATALTMTGVKGYRNGWEVGGDKDWYAQRTYSEILAADTLNDGSVTGATGYRQVVYPLYKYSKFIATMAWHGNPFTGSWGNNILVINTQWTAIN